MRTTTGRMTLFVLLFALAACVTATSVQASTGVQYGIQDDAWLEFGPGTLDQRLTAFKRLGVPLVRFTLRWNEIAPRRPKDPTSPRDRAYDWRRADRGSARASPPRSDARAHPRRHAGVGERGARAAVRSAAAPGLPPLRDRRRPSLSVGSLLADLERAEQAPLAQADESGDLRPASAQPRVRGDPRGAAACSGRRRRDRAEGGGGRRLTRHLGARHGRRPSEVRRLRAPPLPLDAVGDPVQRRLQELPVDHDGDDQEAPHPRQALLRFEADLADGVRLPDEPAGHVPGRAPQAAGDESQPRRDEGVAAAQGDDADPVPLPRRAPAQPLPDRPRLRGRPLEALAAGIQAALRADGAPRAAGDHLGPGPRRTAGAKVVPARGAPARTCGSRSGAPG